MRSSVGIGLQLSVRTHWFLNSDGYLGRQLSWRRRNTLLLESTGDNNDESRGAMGEGHIVASGAVNRKSPARAIQQQLSWAHFHGCCVR